MAAVSTMACGADGALDLMRPEVVAATPPKAMPGGMAARQYWAEVAPREGRVNLYPIHPGNVIYRGEVVTTALTYNYSGTATTNDSCTPGVNCPANTVHLFTDQSRVTYVEGTTCFNNGNVVDLTVDATCGGAFLHDGCNAQGVFCAPLEMINNFGQALADPVIDLANPGGAAATPIAGCVESPAQDTGLCASEAPAKIAPATSAYVASIPGSGGTQPCAYCYANNDAAIAATRPGLSDGIPPGVDATLRAINTDAVSLLLSSPDEFGTTITVYFSTPQFEVPGAQLSMVDSGLAPLACFDPAVPTTLVLSGGGFGPPGGCLGGGLPAVCSGATGCCTSGPPGASRTVTLAGVTAAQTPTDWSDLSISTALPQLTYGCRATLTAFGSTFTSDDEIVRCPDTWRSFSPPLLTPKAGAAGGVLGSFLVVAGGRTSTSGATATATVRAIPVPRCSIGTPTSVSNFASMPAARWGAASAVATTGLYVIGGSGTDFNTCQSTVYRLPTTSSTSWSTMAPLPAVLCQAAATRLLDRTNGREYIVVAGGIDRPNPRQTVLPAAVLNPNTYVYDIAANTWATFNGAGQVLPTLRYNLAAAANNATPGQQIALFAGGVVVASGDGPAHALATSATLSGGVPTFANATSLPAARSSASAAVVNGRFYVVGGAVSASVSAAGTGTVYSIGANALTGAWTTHPNLAPQARQGGVLGVAAFNEPVQTDLRRLLWAGGSTGGFTLANSVNEFNP